MATRKPNKRWGMAAIGVAVAALFITWATAQGRPTGWHVAHYGPTLPLSEAAVIDTGAAIGVVWQPEGSAPPFVYTSLDAQRSVPLQPYAEDTPIAWRVVQTKRGTLQMVWQERSGRLRGALFSAQGDTLRGPVKLAEAAEKDFALVALAEGGAWALWRTASERIASAALDADGRPQPMTVYAPRHVQRLAAAADQTRVYVVWAERSAPNALTLRYAAAPAPNAAAEALMDGATLGTWTLGPQESVRSFALGVDATHGYVLLGVAKASAPHHERVTVLSFPLEAPDRVQRIPLTLAARPTPKSALSLGTHLVLQAEAPPAEGAEAAPLRWPRPAQHSPGDFFALALAVWREGKWQPTIVYFQAGVLRGYEVISAPPADAAPPTLALRPDGTTVLSWAGLVRGKAQRYVARRVPQTSAKR